MKVECIKKYFCSCRWAECLYFICLFLCGAENWIQCLTHAGQALYNWTITSAPNSYFSLFHIRQVLHALCFFPFRLNKLRTLVNVMFVNKKPLGWQRQQWRLEPFLLAISSWARRSLHPLHCICTPTSMDMCLCTPSHTCLALSSTRPCIQHPPSHTLR